MDRADYTVGEWCRQGRIRAKKKLCGRGKDGEWLVAHDEFVRMRNEGLLPFHLMTEGKRYHANCENCSDETQVPQHQA